MISRRLARECVLKALYAHTMGGGEKDHVVALILRPQLQKDKGVFSFAERLFVGTLEMAAQCDRLIKEHAANWDLARLAILDRLVLRMAICELLTFADIPPKVTINESIELAKRYSTERSGPFVNGVLDAVVYVLDRRGQLKKSGRGMRGMEALRERMAVR